MHIVITGGMGCGKSTVTSYLKSCFQNYHFYDMDERVRALYNDRNMQDSLDSMFGTHHRKQISDIVFSNKEARERLYRLMNAIIFKQVADQRDYKNVFYDIPLYWENSDLQSTIHPDAVICISCSAETQKQRIRSRDNISDEKIQSILSLQKSLPEKEDLSDYVIRTDGTHEDTINQLTRVLIEIGM